MSGLVAQFCITQAPAIPGGERASLSATGFHWTQRVTALDGINRPHSIAFGAGVWVYGTDATGSDVEVIQTSPDGKVWTARSSPADTGQVIAVIWIEDLTLFVAMASVSGSSIVLTSADGFTWSSHTIPSPGTVFLDLAWSHDLGLIAAVGGSGANNVMTSTDGASWTDRTGTGANDWVCIEWGAGLFVAFNATVADGPPQIMTSTDGLTWTTGTTISSLYTFFDVVFADGRFVAVGAAVSPTDVNRVATSTDGLTWSTHAVTARTWHGVTWGNGVYVACASDAFSSGLKNVMTSHDGATWLETGTDVYPVDCSAIAFNGGKGIGNYFDGPGQGGNQLF